MGRQLAWIVLAGLSLPGARSSAEEAQAPAGAVEEVPVPEGRILNGHTFMPSAEVPGALVTTSFASALQLGLGSTSGTFHVGDRTFSGDYDYAGLGSTLGFEYAFLRYFSARLTVDDVIYSGINGNSALAVGTSLRVGFLAGLTASLPLGDSLRLAFLFDAGSRPGLALTIASGLQAIIDSCGTPAGCDAQPGTLFSNQNAVAVQPALAASWAPWSALGLTASAAYLHASQNQGSTTVSGDAVVLGLATDFDFHAISEVPVGVLLQVSWTAPVSGTGGLQHVTDLGGGLFYTGRKNLALGVQLVARRFAVQPDLEVSFSTFLSTIGLRYYW